MKIELNGKFKKDIQINIEADPYLKNGSSAWYGFPISGINLSEISGDASGYLNQVSGYYLYVYICDDYFLIASDIASGFRIYSYEDSNRIVFSDKYAFIIESVGNFQIDYNQFNFWKKHRFTFGDRTFLYELNKVPPHTILKVSEKTIEKRSYFKEGIKNIPNPKSHELRLDEIITEQFSNLKKVKSKGSSVVLLFSGGKDSVYLATKLKKLRIEFNAVFFYVKPEFKSNYSDYLRASSIAEKLNIPFEKIEIVIEEAKEMLPMVMENMLFDRHFSVIHFEGFRKLKKTYNSDTIFINGQSSDSILSFGPSENRIGCFLRRALLYYPSWLTWPMKLMLEIQKKRVLQFPRGENEVLRAFIDEKDYIFLLNGNESLEYNHHLDDYTGKLTNSAVNLLTKQMLIKINTFLQGSDNQVSILSAKSNGFNNVLMPFASPEVIYETIKFKSNFRELFYPKYVIRREIKSKTDNKQDSDLSFVSLELLEETIYEFFYNEASKYMK